MGWKRSPEGSNSDLLKQQRQLGGGGGRHGNQQEVGGGRYLLQGGAIFLECLTLEASAAALLGLPGHAGSNVIAQ